MDPTTQLLLNHYYYKRFVLKCKLEDCNINTDRSFDVVKAKMKLEKELKETEIRIKMITMETDFDEL